MNMKKSSSLDKVMFSIMGPVVGMLPSRTQIRRFGFDNASLASTSSRVFNIALSLYSFASATRLFGDIDPTPENILTKVGLIIAADTVLRETLYATCYVFNGGSPRVTYHEPFGEPVTSFLDYNR